MAEVTSTSRSGGSSEAFPVATRRGGERARIPLPEPHGLIGRFAAWYTRRKFGKVTDPLRAMAHSPAALLADGLLELRVAKLKRLGPTLTALATMASSAPIECQWCIDFGYFEAHHEGVQPAKLENVTRWREATVYNPVERRVLEFAEAATATPPTVTDDLVAALRADLGDAGMVELAFLVAVENLRSRFNASMGLTSEGFSDACRVR